MRDLNHIHRIPLAIKYNIIPRGFLNSQWEETIQGQVSLEVIKNSARTQLMNC